MNIIFADEIATAKLLILGWWNLLINWYQAFSWRSYPPSHIPWITFFLHCSRFVICQQQRALWSFEAKKLHLLLNRTLCLFRVLTSCDNVQCLHLRPDQTSLPLLRQSWSRWEKSFLLLSKGRKSRGHRLIYFCTDGLYYYGNVVFMQIMEFPFKWY